MFVTEAPVRTSAANLASPSLQQYHQKYSTHTMTPLSVLTTGCIVTSAVLLPVVCNYSRLITHCTAWSGFFQMQFSTLIKKTFVKSVCGLEANTSWLFPNQARMTAGEQTLDGMRPAYLTEHSGLFTGQRIRSRWLQIIEIYCIFPVLQADVALLDVKKKKKLCVLKVFLLSIIIIRWLK